jgi:hypothetical protein
MRLPGTELSHRVRMGCLHRCYLACTLRRVAATADDPCNDKDRYPANALYSAAPLQTSPPVYSERVRPMQRLYCAPKGPCAHLSKGLLDLLSAPHLTGQAPSSTVQSPVLYSP